MNLSLRTSHICRSSSTTRTYLRLFILIIPFPSGERRCREVDLELNPLSRLTGFVEGAAMDTGVVLGNVQAQAGAARRGEERLKDPAFQVGRHPRAVVGVEQFQAGPVPRQAKPPGVGLLGEFSRERDPQLRGLV